MITCIRNSWLKLTQTHGIKIRARMNINSSIPKVCSSNMKSFQARITSKLRNNKCVWGISSCTIIMYRMSKSKFGTQIIWSLAVKSIGFAILLINGSCNSNRYASTTSNAKLTSLAAGVALCGISWLLKIRGQSTIWMDFSENGRSN